MLNHKAIAVGNNSTDARILWIQHFRLCMLEEGVKGDRGALEHAREMLEEGDRVVWWGRGVLYSTAPLGMDPGAGMVAAAVGVEV